jgi:hypothetical protein
MTKKQNRAKPVPGAGATSSIPTGDDGRATNERGPRGMAKSSPHGGKGVPDEPNGAARRDAEMDAADEAQSGERDGEVVRTPGPGPRDRGAGSATRESLEQRGLDRK